MSSIPIYTPFLQAQSPMGVGQLYDTSFKQILHVVSCGFMFFHVVSRCSIVNKSCILKTHKKKQKHKNNNNDDNNNSNSNSNNNNNKNKHQQTSTALNHQLSVLTLWHHEQIWTLEHLFELWKNKHHHRRPQRVKKRDSVKLPFRKRTWMYSSGVHLRQIVPQSGLPSGKLTKNYGKSPCSMGKLTINGHFQ